jgi:hypothetical protein
MPDPEEGTNIILLVVTGKVESITSFFPDKEREPVKLWEAIAPAYMGPPDLSRSDGPLGPGRILNVIDHPTDEIARRTYWRIP